VAAFAFNVTANLLLIPRYSFVAAAWVTVASELVLLLPFRWAVRGVAADVSLVREAKAPILATLLMAPVVWWLRDALHPLAAIVAGAMIYSLALWALGGMDREWLAFLRHGLPQERLKDGPAVQPRPMPKG
jgi:O-antigen/teichoic acid export membrane protein